jgi:hypothetical protein
MFTAIRPRLVGREQNMPDWKSVPITNLCCCVGKRCVCFGDGLFIGH